MLSFSEGVIWRNADTQNWKSWKKWSSQGSLLARSEIRDRVGRDSINYRTCRNYIFSTNDSENKTWLKRWLYCRKLSFSSRSQSQATARPSSLEFGVIVLWCRTISSYQILIALGTSHNATISTVLHFPYVGVIARIYKARPLPSTSQVTAAFKSEMFDNKQVWTSVGCSSHSLLNKVWPYSLDRL